jgi:two-component system sensor histidine kinase HydH
VVINLALNAQRAMADTGGLLKVTTSDCGGGMVEIVVSDNGPGIAEADLPHIFTPFFSRSGGTGLGLALAAQIVKSHRGTIDVASQVGQGATFTVRIPASVSHD